MHGLIRYPAWKASSGIARGWKPELRFVCASNFIIFSNFADTVDATVPPKL